MRKEIIYIAGDGRRFNSAHECEKYENNLQKEHDLSI